MLMCKRYLQPGTEWYALLFLPVDMLDITQPPCWLVFYPLYTEEEMQIYY